MKSFPSLDLTCMAARRRAARARAISNAIDRQIEEEKKSTRECTIVFLGCSGSGKSTLVRQLRKAPFSQEEIFGFKKNIYTNLLESAQAMVRAVGCTDKADEIIAYSVSGDTFSPDIAHAIHTLWNDKIVSVRRDGFPITDNAEYFMQDALRIGAPDYTPTQLDILHMYDKGTAFTELHLSLTSFPLRVLEIGGERYTTWGKRWMHYLEGVTSIVFCSALSDYDDVPFCENKLKRSLDFFESIACSRWMSRSSIILFLTKVDIFKTKLAKIPLERSFPEYTGSADTNKAAKFILWNHMQRNRARLSVYPNLTQIPDTSHERLVVAAVKETILQNALRDSNILDVL